MPTAVAQSACRRVPRVRPPHASAFYPQPETLRLLLDGVANDLTAGSWCTGCGLQGCGPKNGKNPVTPVNELACGYFSPAQVVIAAEGMGTSRRGTTGFPRNEADISMRRANLSR
ncbi:hypothetical protein FN846DRAFT_912956 [Sphaerosporella brunnea]|uniref:Uncharacterized protein n=1 Tax=Sphaerosporella brunnea TaxID=1250544 RepID=A0A5J5EGH9_9PEZI|nr:hypothetical protein FN846DRAFT_912956 [Sphaerosporella brunnea]